MSGTDSTRWFWSAWMSDPGLRACGYAARGLWLDLLCIAGSNKHDYGHVALNGRKLEADAIARMTSGSIEEVERLLGELERNGVFSRTRGGVIYCRRMVRSEKNRRNGRLGGEAKVLKDKENQNSPTHIAAKTGVANGRVYKERAGTRGRLSSLKDSDSEKKKKTLPPSDWPADYQDRFWNGYPRRTEKLAAMKRLDAIHKSGKVAWRVIVAGLLRYAASVVGWEQRYIKHPTTWLEKGCWDDEYKTTEGGNGNAEHRNGGGPRTGQGYGEIAASIRAGRAQRAAAASVPADDGPGDTAAVVEPLDG